MDKMVQEKVATLYKIDNETSMIDHKIGYLSFKNGLSDTNYRIDKHQKNMDLTNYKKDK